MGSFSARPGRPIATRRATPAGSPGQSSPVIPTIPVGLPRPLAREGRPAPFRWRCLALAGALAFPGSTGGPPAGAQTTSAETAVTQVAGGRSFTCALTTAGGLRCWGSNNYGQLGDNSEIDRYTPVAALLGGVVSVAPASYHTCALTTAGGVKCWGFNDDGELGGKAVAPEAYTGFSFDTPMLPRGR